MAVYINLGWASSYMPEWPTFVEKLGPVIALLGVIGTIAWNAWKDRADATRRENERKNELITGKQKAADALVVLRSSLAVSMVNLWTMADEEIHHLSGRGRWSTWVPLLDYFEVYRANLDKVGLLDKEAASAMTNAYFAYQEYAGYIARRSGVGVDQPIIGVFAEFSFEAADEHPEVRDEIKGGLRNIRDFAAVAATALGKDRGWRRKSVLARSNVRARRYNDEHARPG